LSGPIWCLVLPPKGARVRVLDEFPRAGRAIFEADTAHFETNRSIRLEISNGAFFAAATIASGDVSNPK
jgi:hypothetical protein